MLVEGDDVVVVPWHEARAERPGKADRVARFFLLGRILATDPRITIEVSGHLLPNYLREEIDRLSFGAHLAHRLLLLLLQPPSIVGSASTRGVQRDLQGLRWSGRQESNLLGVIRKKLKCGAAFAVISE